MFAGCIIINLIMLPPTHVGPSVNGRLTNVSTLSVIQLSGSALLPSLFRLINTAFDDVHTRRLPPIAGGYPPRFVNVDEILQTLRDDPQTFISIVSFADAPEEILATASCRPYTSVDDAADSLWVRRLGPEEGCVEWEFKLLAVDPKYQGLGLASYLTKKTEEEAAKRSRAALAAAVKAHDEHEHKAVVKRVRMVLVGVKEVTNEFYTRRGYKNDYEIPRIAGYPITFVSMSKVIAEL
jgi:GNAT superfamily N-acetyltransferase